MVLAERNSDPVRNGRRSRGPSPNSHGVGGVAAAGAVGSATGNGGSGHNTHQSHSAGGAAATAAGGPGLATPESSDDDNSVKRNGKSKSKQSEYEEKIRVGRDYQAVCPQLINEVERKPELLNERALLVWSPTKDIPDPKLEEYIAVAKEKYGYNGEQALGMLFWHKHDLERAVLDLANFTPFPDEWTVEDKVLFEQAFQFHGKSFHRIRQMLPDKSIASLVKYYYSWKKTRHRSSAIDRHEKAVKAVVKEGSENGSEIGSNEESDADEKLLINEHISSSSGAGGGNSIELIKTTSTTTTDSENITGVVGISSGHMDTDLSFVSAAGNAIGGLTTVCGSVGHIDGIMGGGIDGISGGGGNGSNDSNDDAALDGGGKPSINGLINSNGGGIQTGVACGTSTSSNKNMGGGGGSCKNCGIACHQLHISLRDALCSSCHIHLRRTGNKRPTSGPYVGKRSRFGADRSKRKPPRGMYINHDDLLALAAATNTEDYLAEGDRKIASLMDEIQANKQKIEMLDKECNEIKSNGDEIPSVETQRVTGRWTNDEMQLAAMFMGDHGKDFQAIAKLIGTKTEAHIRTFYINNRRRMNLDVIIREHEDKKAAAEAADAAANNGDAAVTVNAGGVATTAGASTGTGLSASTSVIESGSGGASNITNTSGDSDVTLIDNLDTSNENSSTTNVSVATATTNTTATAAAITATGANSNNNNNNNNSALLGGEKKNEASTLIASKQKGGSGGGEQTNADKQDKTANNNNNSTNAASTSSAVVAAISSSNNNSSSNCSSSSLSSSTNNSNTASNNNNSAITSIQGVGITVSGTAAAAATIANDGKKDKEKLIAATIAIIADESDTNTTTTSTSSSAELTTNASKSNSDGTTKSTSVGAAGASVSAQMIAHKRDSSTLQSKDDGQQQPAAKKVALSVSTESLPTSADK